MTMCAMRFSANIIRSSFTRLRQIVVEGKSGIERTSALMYFLAQDAAFGEDAGVSLDPYSSIGRLNRDKITAQYSKLVTLRVLGLNKVWSVADLGLITRNGTVPEKRISSNFLTVPLKKASQISTPTDYPSRPVPLLQLGSGLKAGEWGIAPHPDWKKNIPIFLSERITRWPFTDLAVFVLRDSVFDDGAQFPAALEALLHERFSESLCSYWLKLIDYELKNKIYKLIDPWRDTQYHNVFDDETWVNSICGTEEAKAYADRIQHLELRLMYLEGLLKKHHIPYDKEQEDI